MMSGIKIQEKVTGTGRAVERGTSVTIRYRLALNKGEVIQEGQMATFAIGKRQVIAGLEYGVQGMRADSRRIISVGPHLGYHDVGVPGVVPANAVLVFDVELLEVQE